MKTDHDLLIEINERLSNHLAHHVSRGQWLIMIGLVLVSSFIGPLVVKAVTG